MWVTMNDYGSAWVWHVSHMTRGCLHYSNSHSNFNFNFNCHGTSGGVQIVSPGPWKQRVIVSFCFISFRFVSFRFFVLCVINARCAPRIPQSKYTIKAFQCFFFSTWNTVKKSSRSSNPRLSVTSRCYRINLSIHYTALSVMNLQKIRLLLGVLFDEPVQIRKCGCHFFLLPSQLPLLGLLRLHLGVSHTCTTIAQQKLRQQRTPPPHSLAPSSGERVVQNPPQIDAEDSPLVTGRRGPQALPIAA